MKIAMTPLRILVTAGNTITPIDRVRVITNIFTGRTGARIALHGHELGHAVELLTSHPEVVAELPGERLPAGRRCVVHAYRTFEELHELMARRVREGNFDALIHSAAVSDYQPGGVFAPDRCTRFSVERGVWESTVQSPPRLVDRSAAKVKSAEPELWLRLVRSPKLVDLIRTEWAFGGILVKFKLEVGVSDEQLLDIAERSRCQSAADLMVANTLEDSRSHAFLGPLSGGYQCVSRRDLAPTLLAAVERLYQEKRDG